MEKDIRELLNQYCNYEEHTREFYDVSSRIISRFSPEEYENLLESIYEIIPELKNEILIQGACHLIGMIKAQQQEQKKMQVTERLFSQEH